MVRPHPTFTTEESPDRAQDGYFLFDSLRQTQHLNAPKIRSEMLTGTVADVQLRNMDSRNEMRDTKQSF